MPIPNPVERGLLPVGLHACTLAEVAERFGQFHSSDRRVQLQRALEMYTAEVRSTNLVAWLIVNGSFVTGKPDPSDIDLVVVLRSDHDLSAPLAPFEYNVVSRKRVRRRHGLDILVAREGSRELDEYLAFFQQVKNEPALQKGVLRVDP